MYRILGVRVTDLEARLRSLEVDRSPVKQLLSPPSDPRTAPANCPQSTQTDSFITNENGFTDTTSK